MMIGLSIHAFLEGMPIIDFTTSSISQPLLIGIIIHNIPIAIALMTVLLSANISKYKAMFWLAIFALMSPLGSVFSYILNVNFVASLGQYYTAIMALVIGIFLHISTTILFESSDNHKFNIMKFVVIIAGAFIAYLTI
jgi:zinc transporter ZupT